MTTRSRDVPILTILIFALPDLRISGLEARPEAADRSATSLSEAAQYASLVQCVASPPGDARRVRARIRKFGTSLAAPVVRLSHRGPQCPRRNPGDLRGTGWSLAAACQPGLGTAPVRTSSSATSRSLVLVRWEAWVRMVNASSSLILCRSIKMPLACSIKARDIIAVRR